MKELIPPILFIAAMAMAYTLGYSRGYKKAQKDDVTLALKGVEDGFKRWETNELYRATNGFK